MGPERPLATYYLMRTYLEDVTRLDAKVPLASDRGEPLGLRGRRQRAQYLLRPCRRRPRACRAAASLAAAAIAAAAIAAATTAIAANTSIADAAILPKSSAVAAGALATARWDADASDAHDVLADNGHGRLL